MMRVEQASEEAARAMVGRFRDADIAELSDGYRMDPLDAILISLSVSSKSWTIRWDDVPVAIGGVSADPAVDGKGYPWMITTVEMDEARVGKAFLLRSRPILREMLKVYDHLENYVDARNTRAIAWLRWLGFTIHDPVEYGFGRLPFHHFELRS